MGKSGKRRIFPFIWIVYCDFCLCFYCALNGGN